MRASVRFVYQGYTVTCFTEKLSTGRYAAHSTIASPESISTAPTQWTSDDRTFASEESATEFAVDAVKRLIDHRGETDWTPLV
jgi:hypothetical protein